MAAASSQCRFSPATSCLSSFKLKHCKCFNSPNFFKPIPSLSSFPSVVISPFKLAPSRCKQRLIAVAELGDSNSETYPDADAGNSNEGNEVKVFKIDLLQVASIDTKLPRRSLLEKFTCGECGGRTDRLINRLAYERGTVYVQCAGCEKYHKLVDNLGLVVEYDLREKIGAEIDAGQVP